MDRKYNLCFTKAVASGNDFIILDNLSGELSTKDINYSEMAIELCPRRISIGADGILVLERSDKADLKMRIINPDGSEVDMCGNGARCSAVYASKFGLGEELDIETRAGIISASVKGNNVKLKMSEPKDIKTDINLGIGKSLMKVHYLNTGVPHVVHLVDNIETYDVHNVGRQIRRHTMFEPDGTNANFVGEKEDGRLMIRTYERGVEEETLACGTGTVATAVTLGLLDQVTSPVSLLTKSGEVLKVYYEKKGNRIYDVYLEGEAALAWEGKI
ncbi:MAG: diaminopimelate epimerase [Candidatus Aadella gelida]|nr:diaminopimelate epimerase [Candidatus Aadella gelida]